MINDLPERYRTMEGFAALFDHTLLKAEATPAQIEQLCVEARQFGFKGVCVNPCYVALATRLMGTHKGPRPIAVVGFPLGANRTDVKIDEAMRAIGDGAWEIDMVMNVGLYLGGDKDGARADVAGVVRATEGIGVKVILETAYLSPDQIAEVSRWCVAEGAAFVKTSTGFGPRGATLDDIAAMKNATDGKVGIKASGGIKTLEAVLALVKAGATRVGSSGSVKILSDFRALTALHS